MNHNTLGDLIDAHINGWLPTTIIRENAPSPTQSISEYIVITDGSGEAFIGRRTGMLSVRGNYLRHPLTIRFQIRTKINAGKERSRELVQAIQDHWFYAQIDPFLTLDTITDTVVGELPPHYVTNVDIGGFWDERIP